MNKDRITWFLEDIFFVFPYFGLEWLVEKILPVRIHRGNREWIFLSFALINGIPGGLLGATIHPLFFIWLGIGIILPLVWWCHCLHPFGYAWLEESRKYYRQRELEKKKSAYNSS